MFEELFVEFDVLCECVCQIEVWVFEKVQDVVCKIVQEQVFVFWVVEV